MINFLTFVWFSILSSQVLSLRVFCTTTMIHLCFNRLILIILALTFHPSLGCPSSCRCYSLTVECGSLGIKEIPQGVPSVTEVSWPVGNKLGHELPVHSIWPRLTHHWVFISWLPLWAILITPKWLWLINSPWPSLMWAQGRGCAVGCVIIHSCSESDSRTPSDHLLRRCLTLHHCFPLGFRPPNITVAHEY